MSSIAQLIIRHLKQQLSSGEQKELDDWMAASADNRQFFHQYTEEYLASAVERMQSIDWRSGYQKFLSKYDPATEQSFTDQPMFREKKRNIIPLRFTWIAAAAVILFLGAAVYFWWLPPASKPSSETTVAPLPARYKNDIAPGGFKAVLTLANATSIVLDTVSSATLKEQGSSAINQQGTLQYQQGRSTHGAAAYNTVTTPRGGYYQVVLPDGSKVWLNAASSIRFPVAFSGDERKVTIMGEAYFEVAPASTPFIVMIKRASDKEASLRVLGTHFNINAYDDEPAIAATLLEGSVEIKAGHQTRRLQPGQQARIGNERLAVIDQADLSGAVAWKNGYFSFKGTDIQTVMRQVARWYDVDITTKGNIPHAFVATISRKEPVSKLLQLLELTDEVQFSIEGKTISVQP